MSYSTPPQRGTGQQGHVGDHELIRLALVDIASRLSDLETDVASALARAEASGSVSAPSSPATGQIWIDLP